MLKDGNYTKNNEKNRGQTTFIIEAPSAIFMTIFLVALVCDLPNAPLQVLLHSQNHYNHLLINY